MVRNVAFGREKALLPLLISYRVIGDRSRLVGNFGVGLMSTAPQDFDLAEESDAPNANDWDDVVDHASDAWWVQQRAPWDLCWTTELPPLWNGELVPFEPAAVAVRPGGVIDARKTSAELMARLVTLQARSGDLRYSFFSPVDGRVELPVTSTMGSSELQITLAAMWTNLNMVLGAEMWSVASHDVTGLFVPEINTVVYQPRPSSQIAQVYGGVAWDF
jgi:hypothetical protein